MPKTKEYGVVIFGHALLLMKKNSMKTQKNSNKGLYALIVGIAGGFACLAILAITLLNDSTAAEIASALAIFCSLLAVFLTTNDASPKSCAKSKNTTA